MSQKKYVFDSKWQRVHGEFVSERNWLLLLFSCHLRWKILFVRRWRMTEMGMCIPLSKISKQRNPFRWKRERNATKTRLFNIQNGDRVYNYNEHCVVCQMPPSGRADNHTLEHDKRTRVYRYAIIHFRETQTEFINVRLKLISTREREKKMATGVQKDPLSVLSQCHVPMWMLCVRHILFDFHKFIFLSNAIFADPEKVKRIFHIRWMDEKSGIFDRVRRRAQNSCALFWESFELHGIKFGRILMVSRRF